MPVAWAGGGGLESGNISLPRILHFIPQTTGFNSLVATVALSVLVSAADLPSDLRRWTPIGPYGGGAEVIAVDPSQPGRVYSLTKNAFLYRSDDEGRSWTLVRFPAQQSASAHALAMHPSRPGELWIGVSSARKTVEGIYHSIDHGATWTHLEALSGTSVFSLAIYAKDSNWIAAGARDGVHLSKDGGQTWERISPIDNRELQPVMSLAFDPRTEKTIYAGTPHLPWKTEDGGANWKSIHHGMIDDSDILSLIVNQKNPSQLFIGACSGIYRSDNSAGNWSKLLGITGAGYRTYAVAQDPFHPEIVFSGTRDGLWKSTDTGRTWKKLAPYIVKSIAISPAEPGKMFLATQESGILKSNDGGETLLPALDGFADHRMNQIAAGSRSIYVTGGQDLEAWRGPSDGASPVGHKSWKRMTLPVPGSRVSFAVNGESVYAVSGGAVYSSPDQGGRWVRLPALTAPVLEVRLAGDKDVLAITAHAIYQNAAGPLGWKALPPPPTPKPQFGRLFARRGSRELVVEANAVLWYSPDFGRTWVSAGSPAAHISEINDILIDHETLIAATARGLFRAKNAGTPWELVTTGIDPGTIAALASSPSGLFAAQYGRVFRSTDSGVTWKEIPVEGLDESSILRLASTPAGKLIALTPSRGVFVFEDRQQSERAGDGNAGAPGAVQTVVKE